MSVLVFCWGQVALLIVHSTTLSPSPSLGTGRFDVSVMSLFCLSCGSMGHCELQCKAFLIGLHSVSPTWKVISSFGNIGANSWEDIMDYIFQVACEYLGSKQYSCREGRLGGRDHIVAMATQYMMDVGFEKFSCPRIHACDSVHVKCKEKMAQNIYS